MQSSLWSSKNTLVFWYQQWLRSDIPFHLKFAIKVTHSFLKSADFDQYLLISTVRASKKAQLSRIGSQPRAFQRAIDKVHTLHLRPPNGGSKNKFVIFVNKNPFKSNKLCSKVSLCENFQRQSCSRTVRLSNGVYMWAVNVNLEPNI